MNELEAQDEKRLDAIALEFASLIKKYTVDIVAPLLMGKVFSHLLPPDFHEKSEEEKKMVFAGAMMIAGDHLQEGMNQTAQALHSTIFPHGHQPEEPKLEDFPKEI